MSYTVLPDGSLAYPNRGSPPPDSVIPEGYKRDPGDPYLFLLAWPDCQHRECSRRILSCGKYKEVHGCKKYEVIPISIPECQKCVKQGLHV